MRPSWQRRASWSRARAFRELRWRRFEHALGAWLETPEERFAEFCARQREEADRRALLRRVALASSVLRASCVGCVLRLALVSRCGGADRALEELLTGAR